MEEKGESENEEQVINVNHTTQDDPGISKTEGQGEPTKPAETPENLQSTPEKTKSKKRKIILIVVIILVIIALIAAGLWYFMFNKSAPTTNYAKTQTKSKNKSNAFVETDPQVLKFITPTTGETWLDKPVAIAKQGYFKYMPKEYYAGESETDYYRVGARGKNTIIMTVTPGVTGNVVYLYEKAPNGTITCINHPSSTATYNSDYQNSLPEYSAASVVLSNDIHYDSLSVPDQIKIDQKGSVITSPEYATVGYSYTAPKSNSSNNISETLIRRLGGSAIYRYESTSAETGLTSISYFVKTPISTQIDMGYEPLELSLKGYKWQSGFADSTDTLKAITHGCGMPIASVTRTDSVDDDDVKVAGKSTSGKTIYEFTDSTNPILGKAYDEYKEFNKSIENSSIYTLSEFIQQHGLVLYKDINGKWLVYVRTSLAPIGGCAKPVVYLYPTTSQWVTVKVGADVKISDPYYNPKYGWKAYAKPDGSLTVNNVNYDSLFWEGPGYGQYPEITEGTVVKKQDAIATIRRQLSQQGLNQKEAGDFIAYWQDKMPDKPFVRLTWFNTEQMNKLAPLYISPRPDTTIRVFLDYSGLDKPIDIPRQSLKSTPRNGFTVVEWGGLPIQKIY